MSAASKATVKEYKVKLGKQDATLDKTFNLMRFRPPHQINLQDLSNPTLDRQKDPAQEQQPSQGEGSEYGKKRRDEARRRKYGRGSKAANPDNQPWELKERKKGGKHFIGRKEGGVSSNSAYYVLTHCQDGTFEALPIHNWYDFIPAIKYNFLDSEEAEKKFEQRHKTLNYFTVMLSKKTQSAADSESSGLRISDAPHQQRRARGSGSESDDGDDNTDAAGSSTKKTSKPGKNKSAKKKKTDSDGEDSATTDEGEMESREVDYISDDSSGPSENEQRNDKDAQPKQQTKKQVGDELTSDSSAESSGDELDEAGKAIQAIIKKQEKDSSDSSEAEEIDAMDQKEFLSLKASEDPSVSGEGSKSTGTPMASSKQKIKRAPTPTTDVAAVSGDEPPHKKPKLAASITTISEEEVKYYLTRKPITAAELAKKFRSKKTGMDKMKIIERLGEIIQKKLKVERQTIQGKTYFSIK